ncbi:hypothetical protein, partial [Streptosporangium fragile]|uniref:hypothetical protein n=1 Tax=Streptosporangium fragile TaxID=46186 RepID=UPI0031EF8961
LLASAVGDHDAAYRHLTLLGRLAERNGLTWWRGRALAAAGSLPAHLPDLFPRQEGGESYGPGGGFSRAAPGGVAPPWAGLDRARSLS